MDGCGERVGGCGVFAGLSLMEKGMKMDAIEQLTGGHLSRKVAEARGWRFEPTQKIDRTQFYKVFFEGKQVGHGNFPELGVIDMYPDYASEAEAALNLTVKGYRLNIREGSSKWYALYHEAIEPSGQMEKHTVYGTGIDAAEAICRAFLALVEYQKVAKS